MSNNGVLIGFDPNGFGITKGFTEMMELCESSSKGTASHSARFPPHIKAMSTTPYSFAFH